MAIARLSSARLQATLGSMISAALWYWQRNTLTATVAVIMGVLGVLAWLSPRTYAPLQRGMEQLARAITMSLTWLLLALVYFGLFTPLHFWRRVRRVDPLGLRPDPNLDSYLQPLPGAAPDRFDRQF
jgi:hypothetical protein